MSCLGPNLRTLLKLALFAAACSRRSCLQDTICSREPASSDCSVPDVSHANRFWLPAWETLCSTVASEKHISPCLGTGQSVDAVLKLRPDTLVSVYILALRSWPRLHPRSAPLGGRCCGLWCHMRLRIIMRFEQGADRLLQSPIQDSVIFSLPAA